MRAQCRRRCCRREAMVEGGMTCPRDSPEGRGVDVDISGRDASVRSSNRHAARGRRFPMVSGTAVDRRGHTVQFKGG